MRPAMTMTMTMVALTLSTPAAARQSPVQYVKTQWNRQVQALKVRIAEHARVRKIEKHRAARQSFHRAQNKQFEKDFKAWAKDPQIASIYRSQQQNLDLGNLKMRYGLGTTLTGTAALTGLAAVLTGGSPAGPILSAYFFSTMTPDGRQIASKAQYARMGTIMQARAEGRAVPAELLPVYKRDLRVARMKVNREIRPLAQQVKTYDVALQQAK